jgi:hypothetical protein
LFWSYQDLFWSDRWIRIALSAIAVTMGFLWFLFFDFMGGLDFLIDLEIIFMYIIKFTILPVMSEIAMGEAFLISIVLIAHSFPMKFGEGGIPAAFMITILSSD